MWSGMKQLRYAVVVCCVFVAADAAEPVAVVQTPTSQGIYRLPYLDGTEVKVFDDFTSHRPRGRVDFFAINAPEPRRVLAACRPVLCSASRAQSVARC